MGSPASRAGTGRPRARIFSRSPSTRCWSKRWRAPRRRGSTPHGRLAVLLHDAPEYVIGDMISPFKAVIGDSYKAVEHRLLAAIHLRFGLPPTLPETLKSSDQGGRPRRRLTSRPRGWPVSRPPRRASFFGPPPKFSAALERDYLTPWPAGTAETRFRERVRETVARMSFSSGPRHRYDKRSAPYNARMIHVCSLARLYATVDETGARHIVTLLRLTDRVERPRAYRARKPSGAGGRRHHGADRRLYRAGRRACAAADRFRRPMGPRGADGGALLCRHQPLDRRRLCGGLRAQSAARRAANRLGHPARLAHRATESRIVSIADRLLQRDGRMVRAIETIGPGDLSHGRPSVPARYRVSAPLD